jgi:hypothetical protein
MRLLQEFGMRHRSAKTRAATIFTAWVLAAAAVLFAGVSWWNWRLAQTGGADTSAANTVEPNALTPAAPATSPEEDATLVADNEDGDFTLLPGSLPQEIDDSAVVRVGMQRGALSALGLPVNEERASDWIQVDLLVGQDGLPKAVRLPQSQ